MNINIIETAQTKPMLISIFAIAFMTLLIAQTGRADEPAPEANISGCAVFPADNIWNVPIDTLPVHPSSATYINTIGAGSHVHADFGSGTWDGGPIGIPYVTVTSIQGKVDVTFDYSDESDSGPYPIPTNPPIEWGGDHHILILEKTNCILYELYNARQTDGHWYAGSGAIYDLKTNGPLRPAGWTSADAAGLPMLPGLVRYDEVSSNELMHAIRFTVPRTQKSFLWPARHYASSTTDPKYPPMGLRFRLKSDFNTAAFSHDARVIAEALKKYGMMIADNGSSWFISGAPDERWNNDVLHELDVIQGSDFEAVDESSLMIDPNSGQARTGGGQDHLSLLVAINGNGTVTSLPAGINCPGDCSQDYPIGTNVYLTASPANTFHHWEGDASGTSSTTSIIMTALKNVTAVFSQNPEDQWLRVGKPNGGESWKKQSKQTIVWTSKGITGNVRIQISYNGGAKWSSIVAQTENDGSYQWKVKNKKTKTARVRILSMIDPSISDMSDGNFTIK